MQKAELQSRVRQSVALHHRSMLRLAYAYLRTTPDAEDCVQEVFLSYFRAAPMFRDPEHEKAWLLRATINRCKNQLKSAWNTRRAPMPETLEAVDEQSELLHEVLALDEMYRLPIHLHYYEGYSIKEIAALLSEKPATIGTRLARGREQLKAAMGGIEHA